MPIALKLAAFTVLTLLLVGVSARADSGSTRDIILDGKTPVHQIELAGSVSKTLYRYEDYETTCTREVPVTVYRYECDTRDVRDCETIPGSQSCTSHPTRECTMEESCHTTQPYEYCTTRQEQYNCGDRPYTEYRTETYGCTKTRAIPIGTELVEDLVGEVTVKFIGNLAGISGKDTFQVAIGNGVDVMGKVTIALSLSADTHFLKLKTLAYDKKTVGPKKALIRAAYQIEALPVSDALGMKTSITDIDADRGHLILDLTGAKLDEGVKVSIEVQKDRRIGGMTHVTGLRATGKDFKVESTNGGERATLRFFNQYDGRKGCMNRRPHEFDVTLVRELPKLITEGLLNPKALEQVKGSLVSKMKKRIKLGGGKNPQCAKD